jgi:hypothetical protein
MILSGKKTGPSLRFFESVSRAFHVSVEWLRDGTGDMYVVPGSDMSASDASLLAKYRLLPAYERKIVDEVVNAMLLKSRSERESE